jgi:NitT/TauT family transport system substrate-binding protein
MEATLKKRPRAVTAFGRASLQAWKLHPQGDHAATYALIRKDNPNMTDGLLASGKVLLPSGMVFGGDAATLGAGTMTDARLKKTYAMLVSMKLLDPKVDVKKSCTTEFVNDLKIMP